MRRHGYLLLFVVALLAVALACNPAGSGDDGREATRTALQATLNAGVTAAVPATATAAPAGDQPAENTPEPAPPADDDAVEQARAGATATAEAIAARQTEQAVAAGDVAEARIDEAVRRILTVKFELGLFEQPYANPDLMATVGSAEHRALAREAVAQSQVLLRNEEGILPLAADLPRLFVGGHAADDIGIQSGGWTIEWQGQSGAITPGTTILQGIEATVSPDTEVVYDALGQFADSLDTEPVTCIAVVGERPYAEGRGDSRGLRLPAEDQRLLEQMAGNCADLVVVLISGRPLIITELLGAWDALVAAWLILRQVFSRPTDQVKRFEDDIND